MSSPTTHSTSLRCILWWTRLCPPLLTGRGFSRPWSGKCYALKRPSSSVGSEPVQLEKIIMSRAALRVRLIKTQEYCSTNQRPSYFLTTAKGNTEPHHNLFFFCYIIMTPWRPSKQFALSPMFVRVGKEHNCIYSMIPAVFSLCLTVCLNFQRGTSKVFCFVPSLLLIFLGL